MIYEALLLIAVLAALLLLPQTLWAMYNGQASKPAWLYVHALMVLIVYFNWFWQHGGQTLAMKTWHIRLVDAHTGLPIGKQRSLLRFALSWPSLLACGLGVLWAFFDRDRQFLHDRLSGTRLIDTRGFQTPEPSVSRP
jgi:uncharacterized RDD family membrane protein YckC